MTSASTAPASISTTIAAPIVPSGLRRTICTHTSIHHGRDRLAAPSAGVAAAMRSPAGALDGAVRARSESVANSRVEEGIREVDQQIETNDHRRDDEIHRLHDRIVELAERL